MPVSRTEYWSAKFVANVARDERVRDALRSSGWEVLTIWDCQTLDEHVLKAEIQAVCEVVKQRKNALIHKIERRLSDRLAQECAEIKTAAITSRH
jgi:G:T-mismatch repair DNA endonuclease (very short patch repair protein)